ncbi:MAG: alternative ribosome rescue aminoacyl-tRNA hydrolase ArfB [Gaiellales bacterium]
MLDVGAEQPLPEAELEVRFSRAGGPGGQHVNTSATRVEIVLDVESSPSLTDDEKARIRRRLRRRMDADGRLRVVAQDERSQLRNRALATERLAELLRSALAPPPPPRRPTRPGRAATQRRLDEKRRAGERKRARRPPDDAE